MQRETVGRSLLVATCLCIVCSVFVSSAAVMLKPRQEANKQQQMHEDVLRVAGLYQDDAPVAELFEQQVETRIVNLETGEFIDRKSLEPSAYDPKMATKNPQLSVAIPQAEDFASLKRREKYSAVYLVKSDGGALQQIILPIRGKGLWSTMFGFLSLQSDCHTVQGITFYEHGETPGLGGEIESEKFKRQWHGKVVRDPDGTPHIDFVRGSVDPNDPNASHKIDGIAGATLTTRGVTGMVRYWMGPNGFGPFLKKLSGDQADTKMGTAAQPAYPSPRLAFTN